MYNFINLFFGDDNKCEISYYDTQQVFYDAEDKSIIANDYGVREVRRRNIDDDDDEEEEYNIGD